MPLILTRTKDESIIIGDDIIISVMNFYRTRSEVTGLYRNHVRLSLTAPDDISIYREEIYNQIQRDKNHSDEKIYIETNGNI